MAPRLFRSFPPDSVRLGLSEDDLRPCLRESPPHAPNITLSARPNIFPRRPPRTPTHLLIGHCQSNPTSSEHRSGSSLQLFAAHSEIFKNLRHTALHRARITCLVPGYVHLLYHDSNTTWAPWRIEHPIVPRTTYSILRKSTHRILRPQASDPWSTTLRRSTRGTTSLRLRFPSQLTVSSHDPCRHPNLFVLCDGCQDIHHTQHRLYVQPDPGAHSVLWEKFRLLRGYLGYLTPVLDKALG
ncbi:hypothetical protein H2248_007522 [Termitomyces sp. 'cryptogamus']|nr:hypothetical protein H2248_007522 [Termitomyces sp. 'cryptogamus']